MTVEAAFVIPIVLVLVCGTIVSGVAVFRYQQVAFLAREGARWASVRGGQYAKENQVPAPTRQQIIDQAILPVSAGIDPAAVDVAVQWVDQGTGTVYDWDAATKDMWSVNAAGEYVTNTVRVTVTIQAGPGLFGDPVTVQSVCEMPLSN
jgi:Flp pilus assembly protein TadG